MFRMIVKSRRQLLIKINKVRARRSDITKRKCRIKSQRLFFLPSLFPREKGEGRERKRGATEIERHKNVSTLEDCSRVICYKSQLKFNKLYRIVKVARAQERQTDRQRERGSGGKRGSSVEIDVKLSVAAKSLSTF